jgi:hypothetical protein
MTNSNDSKSTNNPIDHYEGYWMIFVMLFMLFIVIALVGQMFFIDWRIWLPGAEKSMSLLDGVSSSVHTVISQVI